MDIAMISPVPREERLDGITDNYFSTSMWHGHLGTPGLLQWIVRCLYACIGLLRTERRT